MKRVLVVSVFVLLSVCTAFGWQEMYRASSYEVQTLMLLERLGGAAFPEMTYPVSGSYLLELLDRIDVSGLDPYSAGLYVKLKNSLSAPEVLFSRGDVGGNANVRFLGFELYTGENSIPLAEHEPVLYLDTSLWITRYFTAKFCFNDTIRRNNYKALVDLKLYSVLGITDAMQTFPDRAYGSLGNSFLNLAFGRDRISAGEGIFGNLGFSENFLYQDYGKFSILRGPVSYDFTVIAYDSWGFDDAKADTNPRLKYIDFNGSNKMSLTHRFSAVLFNRLTLALYEGAMIYGKNILSDIRSLNPFMYIHNWGSYYNGGTNNYFGLEVNVPVAKGIQINAQVMIDQFKLKGEADDSGDTAIGVLLNAAGSKVIGNGILTVYAEGMYGSKGLYLKEKNNPHYSYLSNPEDYEYANYRNIDLVGDYYYFTDSETRYIGYPYGGDGITAGAGASYKTENHAFDGNILFRAKGSYGIGENEDRALSSSHTELNKEYSLGITLGASGAFFKRGGIQYKIRLNYTHYWNYRHGSETRGTVGFHAAVTIDPTALFIDRKRI